MKAIAPSTFTQSIPVSKKETLQDLQRIAAKHGKDYAWCLAYQSGNVRHKESWRQAIAHPARTPEETLDHQMWQQEIQMKFFGKTFLQENQP